mmetsp:Transcript_28069/g.60410  ORF Transcript_28069/g.60410 Transcript_28069/m.60410 type:complete len:277 (+) Transcript_28069:233-1063(+)
MGALSAVRSDDVRPVSCRLHRNHAYQSLPSSPNGKNVDLEIRRDTHTLTYAAIIAGGRRTESSEEGAADRPNISTFARGVCVTAESVADIKLMSHTGISAGEATLATLCARAAAAKKRGKMIPPGKPPAHARAMASSFAVPTMTAACAVANGTVTSTRACAHMAAGSRGQTAESAVRCPSRTCCREPSPQKSVCGKKRPSAPTQNPTRLLTSTCRASGEHQLAPRFRRAVLRAAGAGVTGSMGHISCLSTPTSAVKAWPMSAPTTPAPSAIATAVR